MGNNDKLDLAVAKIEKDYGKGIFAGKNLNIVRMPLNIISLDVILGGGMPLGRIIEVYGPESSGKTTLCLHIIAEAQRLGKTAGIIDMEHALDMEYAKTIGVNRDDVILCQPDWAEQALNVLEALVRAEIGVIVVDSVAALVPKVELDGEMGDAHIGLQARLMSQALRKISPITGQTKSLVVFTNQIREKVGVRFGNPEVTPGGRALKFYASVRMKLSPVERVKGDNGEIVATKTKIETVKNKTYLPYKSALVDIVYGKGISKEASLLDTAVELGLVNKSGSWYSYGEERIQGIKQAVAWLEDNPDKYDELYQQTSEILFSGGE